MFFSPFHLSGLPSLYDKLAESIASGKMPILSVTSFESCPLRRSGQEPRLPLCWSMQHLFFCCPRVKT